MAPGSTTIGVQLYDGAGGTGNVIDEGSTTVLIVAGQRNSVTVSFGGTIAKIVLTVATATIQAGVPVSIPVNVAALDAAGDTIVGSAAYASPIQLSDADPSGTTSVSPSAITSPAVFAQLAYNGASASGAAQITASVSGAGIAPQTVSVPIQALSGVASSQANAFVGSVGVAVHLAYWGTGYDTYFSTVAAMIEGAGIRHVRDGMPYGQTVVAQREQSLSAAGVHFDYLMTPQYTAAQVAGWFALVGPGVADACEGDNEYDAGHGSDPNWVATDRSDQATIYGYCHGAGLPVMAPSVTSESGAQSLGSVLPNADFAVTHDYKGGFNPGTTGWGNTDQYGVYGSTPWTIALAHVQAPGKPVWSSETGYDASVPPAIKARYTLRTLLEHYINGIERTYLYEMLDSGGQTFGLLDGSANPRPAYYGVKNLLGILADPGASFTPSLRPYTLAGASTAIHQLELAKHDGSSYLILWKETQEWDPNAHVLTPATPESVTVRLNAQPSSATVYAQQDDGSFNRSALVPASAMTVMVDGHVTVLAIGR